MNLDLWIENSLKNTNKTYFLSVLAAIDTHLRSCNILTFYCIVSEWKGIWFQNLLANLAATLKTNICKFWECIHVRSLLDF